MEFLTEYSDRGSRCMAAVNTPLWPLHIEHCVECRAVQDRWDAEKCKKRGRGSHDRPVVQPHRLRAS